jgi:hypothetical protein
MSKALIHLRSLCRDLQDRYGSDDPMVQQLLSELRQTNQEITLLPFGERRERVLPTHLWNQRLRSRPARS